MPLLTTPPLPEKIAYPATAPKVGAAGPVCTGLLQPTGVYARIPLTEIAPVVDNARPSSSTSVAIVMAALFAITLPFILVPAAMATAPSTVQKILQAFAPFSNTIDDNELVDKVPPIWKINTALGLFW